MHYHEVLEPITIGRTTGQIICAQDGRMSGKHAEVTLETVGDQQFVFVQDLGSKNHTSVNRVEIPPRQKTKVKLYSLLEIGDQHFVVTENTTANVQDLSEMVDKLMTKPLVKFVAEEELAPPAFIPEASPFEIVQKNEARILQIKNELQLLEQTAKADLLKLEEEKVKLINRTKAKKIELSQIMEVLKIDVEEKKVEMERLKVEFEQKKKKIISLKDIPPDSTEELPE